MTDPLSHQDANRLHFEAGRVFTPGSPLNERDLFAGRQEQVDQLITAISQKGYHAVLFGDRGVGKTSLSNVMVDFLHDAGGHSIMMPRANCDASDDFSRLWTKVLKDIEVSQQQPGVGFTAESIERSRSIVETLPNEITPDDVRRTLNLLTQGNSMVVIFDEFDRIQNKMTTTMMADTIKALSDFGIDATILLIGVADSVDKLIHEHHSVERALMQVRLPRMSDGEVREIVNKGAARLGMEASEEALRDVTSLSQGLPYVTHLIGLNSARNSIKKLSRKIDVGNVQEGVGSSLGQWQQSIISAYHNATRSHQPDNIFREVLVACALATPDELGYFTAGAVRGPLRSITGKNYDIPNFARHLNEFTKEERGPVLQRTGETRRVRYRFVSPLIRPYVVMRSLTDGLLSRDTLDEYEFG